MGIEEKKLYVFVRFGGLNIKRQKGHSKEWDGEYHSPPAHRGFYAMPKVAQEFFLIGSLAMTQPNTFPKHKKDVTWEESERRTKKIYRNIRREFTKKEGNVWHHLGEHTPVREILARHGTWVKTSLSAWRKAFRKSSLVCRYDHGNGSINEPARSGLFGTYSKDHLEVFFDEKV